MNLHEGSWLKGQRPTIYSWSITSRQRTPTALPHCPLLSNPSEVDTLKKEFNNASRGTRLDNDNRTRLRVRQKRRDRSGRKQIQLVDEVKLRVRLVSWQF